MLQLRTKNIVTQNKSENPMHARDRLYSSAAVRASAGIRIRPHPLPFSVFARRRLPPSGALRDGQKQV